MKLIGNHTAISASELLTCPVCSSGLVFPIEYSPLNHDSWRLQMRCPNCFAWRESIVNTETYSAIGRHCCREQQALEEQLLLLEQRHMRETVESFITALYNGQIQPIDF